MPTIQLPDPEMKGGKPLLDLLQQRNSCKTFDEKPLNMQMISNLLWAAFGINRPDSGKRTAPSASNVQEMRLVVIMPDGAYYYDPQALALELIVSHDLRNLSSVQPNYPNAPLHLAYVSDYSQLEGDEQMALRFKQYSHTHAGFIGQNIYLFCASAGLGTCFVASFDKNGLAKALNLTADQDVIYTQIIGYRGDL